MHRYFLKKKKTLRGLAKAFNRIQHFVKTPNTKYSFSFLFLQALN